MERALFLGLTPGELGEESKGLVQLVWQPRSALPSQVQEAIDLNRDGTVDCEISFSNPSEEASAPMLTLNPKSSWLLPAYNSPTTSLEGMLIEKVKDAIFVRIPIRKMGPS